RIEYVDHAAGTALVATLYRMQRLGRRLHRDFEGADALHAADHTLVLPRDFDRNALARRRKLGTGAVAIVARLVHLGAGQPAGKDRHVHLKAQRRGRAVLVAGGDGLAFDDTARRHDIDGWQMPAESAVDLALG